MEEKLYFAYGPNINFDQMVLQCPAAQPVGAAVLRDYELLFRSCTGENGLAAIAPHKGGKVHGLLWKITPECEHALDIDETHSRLCEKREVTVQSRDGRELTAIAYETTNLWLVPAVPRIGYYNCILEGYRQNNLPTAALKRAWEHSVEKVHGLPVRISDPARQRSRSQKRGKGHEQ